MGSIVLSQLAETLIPSEIVRLGAAIKEKIKEGQHIYNYTVGDFDATEFPIPQELQTAIVAAYNNGYTTYPAADGELVLREAVSNFLKRKEGLSYNPSEILISAGGRPLIYAIYRTIVDKGDKVIYPVPSWNNNHYVHFTEGEHVIVEALEENNFMPTAAQLAPHIKGAALLALCSPLNPTGTAFDKDELAAICDLVIAENEQRGPGEKKLYLMYDQIYWTLTFGETEHHNPVTLRPAMKEYTIFVDGISKAFAATGLRVGWSMGPQEIIVKMRGINSHIGSWAPMAEQHAVADFLEKTEAVDDFLKVFKNEIAHRLTGLYDGFKELQAAGFAVDAVAPQAAIYLSVKIDLKGKTTQGGVVLENQEMVTDYILQEARIGIVPFKIFGFKQPNSWYRLSVGTCKKDDIKVVIQQIRAALEKLK